MKQTNLFGIEKQEGKYTSKIKAPIYEPKNKKPHILELYDNKKFKRLCIEIDNKDIPEDEKKFLKIAASRHIVFNYEKIADYYAHSNKDVQHLMEHSALVIIDFEKAIEYGYVKISEDIMSQYVNAG